MPRQLARSGLTLLVLALAGAAGAGCSASDVRSVLYYDFVQLDESAPDQHYQQFVDVHGGIVDLGCFVVQRRQTNCYDTAGNGQPNLHLGVVECTCPCTEEVDDPCDPSRPKVRKGTIRGVVAQVDGPLVLGGVELPVPIDLTDATHLFITVEANADTSPQPSSDVVLQGKLERDGAVVNGVLDCPTPLPVTGRVTIVPATDEVPL
jgi:hypothetical protein